MFDNPPKEPEALSWSYAFLWAGVTFATIPFVRYSASYVRDTFGPEAFTYTVAASVVLATSSALYVTRHRWSLGSSVWLLGLAALLIYLTFGLADRSAEEAIHYVQYGILSVLLFRAFSHRMRDYSIYLAATIAGTLVGMIDETIQWLVPTRVFDLRDMVLNLTAVGLVQVAIAAGVRPGVVSEWPGWASLRRLCYLSAVTIAYLGLCLQNTPERIDWYASNVPGLGFIDANRGVMVEYGHRHDVPKDGFFRSRLTLEELSRASAERADEGRRILDAYRDRDRYPAFLEIYSHFSDPFLHEARVHLFGRDINLERAEASEPGRLQRRYFASAYWENVILETHFGGVLRGSSYEWSAAQAAEVREQADRSGRYESWVSRDLITDYTSDQLALLFAGAVFALVCLGAYAGRLASRQTCAEA